jgi:hypothetical protein
MSGSPSPRQAIGFLTRQVLLKHTGKWPRHQECSLVKRIRWVGGFPGEATFRFQCNGSNICYLASAGTFCTLKIESDVSNANTDPIDVAQVARHYLLRDDEALEKRVLRTGGGHPFELVNAITDLEVSKRVNWNSMDFSGVLLNPKPLLTEVIQRCNKHGPGLVLYFFITEHFRKAASANNTGMGYWRFDGASVDCPGEFVSMNADNMCGIEKQRLKKLWIAQQERASEQAKKRKEKLDDAYPKELSLGTPGAGAGGSPSPRTPHSSSSSTPDNGGTLEHAMVMLGGWHDNEGDPYIMLLNSWKSMPLVLVSPAYLVACRAEICFLKAKLTKDTQVARKEGLIGMCGFPDHGADSRFEFSRDDHISAPP